MAVVVFAALLATLGYATVRSKLTKVASTSDAGNDNDNNEANASATTAAEEDHNGDADKDDDDSDDDVKPQVKYHLYDPGLFHMYTKCEARGSAALEHSTRFVIIRSNLKAP